MTNLTRAFGAAVLAAALAAGAAASTSTTVKPGDFVLRNQDNTIPPGYTSITSRFKTFEECHAAAVALGDTRKCDHSDLITTVSTCADEKAPRIYLAKVTVDGKQYWELPGASWTEDTYIEMAELLVHNAAWPAGFPNCWVKGRAPRSEWRMNSKDEPGKAFMEHLEPGMPTADLLEEVPNSDEPTWHTPEEKVDADAFEAKWEGQQTEYAQLCAAGDTTKCPKLPLDQPGACGWYWSVECGGPGVPPA